MTYQGKSPYRYPHGQRQFEEGVPAPRSWDEGVDRMHEREAAQKAAQRKFHERSRQWRLG